MPTPNNNRFIHSSSSAADLYVVAIKRGNVAADDMKYSDGREETHSCRGPSLSYRSPSLLRSLSASFSLAAEDTDNMQMGQRPMPLFTRVITEWERFDDSTESAGPKYFAPRLDIEEITITLWDDDRFRVCHLIRIDYFYVLFWRYIYTLENWNWRHWQRCQHKSLKRITITLQIKLEESQNILNLSVQ